MDDFLPEQQPPGLAQVEALDAACKHFIRHYVEAQAREEFRSALLPGLKPGSHSLKGASKLAYEAAGQMEATVNLLAVEKPDCLAIRVSAARLRTKLSNMRERLTRYHLMVALRQSPQ